MQRQAREQSRSSKPTRRELQTEWVERQKKRIAELEKNFAATQKQLEARRRARSQRISRTARCAPSSKSKPAAAWASSLGGARRSRCRRRGHAGGIAGGSRRRPSKRRKASSRPRNSPRHARARARIQAGRRFPPPRRPQRRSRSRPAAHEGAARRTSSASRANRARRKPRAAAVAATRRAESPCTRSRATSRRRRRNQRDRLHGRRSHAPRRQIPRRTPRSPASPACASFTATAPARCAAASRNFSSAHPLVERIHAEADDRGGTAVTIVELAG